MRKVTLLLTAGLVSIFSAGVASADDTISLSAIIATLSAASEATSSDKENPAYLGSARRLMQLALTCIKTGEETSGVNKICYYNCAGSGASITVKASELCPLSIERE
jgi:hypothetical protein